MPTTHQSEFDIAIVGMSCRLPGSNSLEQFWSNLASGTESITSFSREQLLASGLPEDLIDHPDYVAAAPLIDNVERFDAALFGYSPKEAKIIDPQQRHLLELSWAALENAGYDPARYDGRVGTFAGVAMNTYLVQSGMLDTFSTNYLDILLGSDKDFLAPRIAFQLGLTGPAITVQSACSTSLVVLHQACQSLLSNECDMTLAAAAAVRAPTAMGHLHEANSVFSREAHCRPFDAESSGTIFGSGAVVLVLKRLTDAQEDGDHVHAVIKGSAVNNDGSSKANFTAPSVAMQTEVIRDALAAADVSAESISYIEAHATGTRIGDNIEVEALTRAFRQDTQDSDYCGIGSVKSNLGHLDAASGLAGVLKTVLAMQNRQIPPSINFDTPNPRIAFEKSPFRVVDKLQPWQPRPGYPRRAGVTSLGMGGTNTHIILQEAPPSEQIAPGSNQRMQLLPLSARTDSALQHQLNNLAQHAQEKPNTSIADIALTLQEGRRVMGKRKLVLAADTASIHAIIDENDPAGVLTARQKTQARDCVFMFPGQGVQYAGMGKQLFESEPVFRDAIKACATEFADELPQSLTSYLYPDASTDDHQALLAQTHITQPTLFATEYAYAKLLQSWGLTVKAMIGHSIGEYVAATLAGVFSLSSACQIVAARGRLMQAAPTGSMLAISLALPETRDTLPASLDIAACNTEDMTVVAGPDEQIDAFAQQLKTKNIGARKLHTSHAFHSRSMQSAKDEFSKELAKHKLEKPSIPFISNSSGDWITDEQATSADYWAQHIVNTVNFADGVKTLLELPPCALIEAGPGTTLTTFANSQQLHKKDHLALSAGQHAKAAQLDKDDLSAALSTMGKLWCAGVNVSWAALRGETTARRIPLPSYPFEGEHHWLSKPKVSASDTRQSLQPDSAWSSDFSSGIPESTYAERLPEEQWFWQEHFTAENYSESNANPRELQNTALVYHASPITDALLRLVPGIAAGTGASCLPLSTRQLKTRKSFAEWLELQTPSSTNPDQKLPETIVYVTPQEVDAESAEQVFLEFTHLVQALTKWEGEHRYRLCLVTFDALPVDGITPNPHNAMLQSAASCVMREWPHISTQFISLGKATSDNVNTLAQRLNDELQATEVKSPLGLGTTQYWQRSIKPMLLDASVKDSTAGKNIIVVGAFGGIGTELVKHLGRQGGTIGLLSRMPIEQEPEHRKTLDTLQSLPAKFIPLQARLEDPENLRKTLRSFADNCGSIDIVYHLGGVSLPAPITQKSDDDLKLVLSAKTHGTVALYNELKAWPQAQLVLFTSISTLITPEGQTDYSAASAFQANFALGKPTVTSIAWPAWQGTGMAQQSPSLTLRDHARQYGVPADAALALIPRLFDQRGTCVYISPCDLDPQMVSAIVNDPRPAADNARQPVVAVPVNETVEDKIALHWCDLLGYEPGSIQTKDDFFDLGGSSLLAIRLLARLERDFEVKLPMDLVLKAPTLSQQAAAIGPELEKVIDIAAPVPLPVSQQTSEHLTAETFDNLISLRAGKTDLPGLFLVHPHGGTVMLYRELARELDADRAVWGLQSQGLNGGAIELKSIEAMAAEYIVQMRRSQTSGPWYLGGYCLGGTIAWEMARQLAAEGQTVGGIFMFESAHRDHPIAEQPITGLKRKILPYYDLWRNSLLRHPGQVPRWRFMLTEMLNLVRSKLSRMASDIEIDVLADIQRADGNELLYAVQRVNRDAFTQYVPGPVKAPVTFYVARHQASLAQPDPTLGYASICQGNSDTVTLEGTYYFDFGEFDMGVIARDIERRL